MAPRNGMADFEIFERTPRKENQKVDIGDTKDPAADFMMHGTLCNKVGIVLY